MILSDLVCVINPRNRFLICVIDTPLVTYFMDDLLRPPWLCNMPVCWRQHSALCSSQSPMTWVTENERLFDCFKIDYLGTLPGELTAYHHNRYHAGILAPVAPCLPLTLTEIQYWFTVLRFRRLHIFLPYRFSTRYCFSLEKPGRMHEFTNESHL